MSKSAYADIGIAERDAGEMALRVALAVEIKKYIEAHDLTQHDAKELFGVPQPTISKISRLSLSGVSLSLLLKMLFKANIAFTLASQGTSGTVRASVAPAKVTAVVVQKWEAGAPKS